MPKKWDYEFKIDGKNYPFGGRRSLALEMFNGLPSCDPESVAETMDDIFGEPTKGSNLGTARRIKGIHKKIVEAGMADQIRDYDLTRYNAEEKIANVNPYPPVGETPVVESEVIL